MARKTRTAKPRGPALCVPKALPPGLAQEAARAAVGQNPANRPAVDRLDFVPSPDYLAVRTSKYWGAQGVDLTVSFQERVDIRLRAKILDHLNAWSEFCSVRFVEASGSGVGKVRISLRGDGYWSYLGTDVLLIPEDQPTMNLQGFSLSTPESEFTRVVRHEAGHTLGFPHEHARRELVEKLDPAKTIAYFQRHYNWDAATTRVQVLTPLEESSILGTDTADGNSIMCYQLPGSITRDGKPILGGANLDADDKAFAARIYPIPAPPPPPTDRIELSASGSFKASKNGRTITLTLE